jgi:ATP-dependent exoDNAse (exonuclease V) alpha subunit
VGSTARQREIAALSTRSNKTETDRATVWQEWSQRANEHAVTFKEVPAEHVDGEQRHQTIAEALTFAVDHITERSAIAEHHQILATAIGKAGPYGGEAGISQIETEIAGRVSRGELIAANMRYTTREAIATETETLRIARAGLGTVRPVVSQLWSPDLGDSPLNPEQREARRSILTSTDRVVCIHGWAGTGKTTLMASVREVAEQNGFSISGIAPSAAAARELSKAGIPSETVASFLSRNAVPGVASIVVLDEAGMVGSREMLGVLDAVARGGSRILLIGDQGQLQAVSAGSPYEQLLTDKTQERNPGTAVQRLTQIVRQKCANLRQAVMKSAGRDVRHALKHLSGTTAEIPSASTRWEQIAKQYARLSRTEREQTVVLTGTNFAREAMNNAIRKKLGRDGQGTAVTIVRPRNLTAAEIRSTVSYAPGDIVQPIKTYKLRPLAASPAASEIKVASRSEAIPWTSGSQATVVRVSKGKVELELPGGARVLWQPAVASRVSTYQRAEIIFAAGELVRATANDHRSGVNNGDLFTVSRIEAGAVTLLRAGSASETVTMDRSRALHLEYGYVSTVHAAQGRTVDRVILDASTRSACANERSFYVAISRARHEAWIYTDDRAALPDAMSRPNEKAKALDISSDGKRKEAEFRA